MSLSGSSNVSSVQTATLNNTVSANADTKTASGWQCILNANGNNNAL